MSCYRRVIIFTILLCTIFQSFMVFSDSGVYNTERTVAEQEIDRKIEEFVRQGIYQTLLKKVGEIVQRALERSQHVLMPQMVYQAVQKVVLGIFKQPSMITIIRDAHKETIKKVNELRDEGATQEVIGETIRDSLAEALEPITQMELFDRILELAVNQAFTVQQKIILLEAVRQQSQIKTFKQQQQAVNQQIQDNIQRAILVR